MLRCVGVSLSPESPLRDVRWQVSAFFAIARNSMSSIAIPCLRSSLMKPLHVTVRTFGNGLRDGLRVIECLTLHKRQDRTGVIGL